ncbi:MAG: alkaline phosphatase family protein [Anaerolineaceae bacterium]|nr:alkaline phosphatase family protein [Anaerolineaceae bacterium]
MALAERVILFVVDGMRPDGMLQADTPTMRRMVDTGAATFAAQTVMPSITLPCHISMFHGLPPEVHGVTTNAWEPFPDGPVPGIIEVVRDARKQAASFYTWEQLRDLSRPGSLAYSHFLDIYYPSSENIDLAIARLAADYLVSARPDFTFIYLGLTDEVGHRYGWMSAEYLHAISVADQAIAHVFERLEAAGMAGTTACLLTSDHGGHGHGHGEDCADDMAIPWILSGPGVKHGAKLSTAVKIYDTAPTIAALLGLPIPREWQGQPVVEAWEAE